MKKIAYLTSKNGSSLDLLMKHKKLYRKKWNISVFSNKDNYILQERCYSLKLPFKYFRSEEELITLLTNRYDLVFSAGYLKILSKKFINIYNNKLIGIHPGKLPELSGYNPQELAIKRKSKETANTIHYVDSGIDTGKIIKEQIEEVYEDDTIESLSERLKIKSIPLIVEVFDSL